MYDMKIKLCVRHYHKRKTTISDYVTKLLDVSLYIYVATQKKKVSFG